jgi:hypothetical protein
MANHYRPESTHIPVFDEVDISNSEKQGLNSTKRPGNFFSKRYSGSQNGGRRRLLLAMGIFLIAVLMGVLLGVSKYITEK